jgi:hypothetical protein
MNYGLRKGLEDIASELKGIRNILATMWHSRYKDGETDLISPEVYADEYISTEECARRLGISDQTIRNWILAGKKQPHKGWVYGIHYINIEATVGRKQLIRIPWNQLIQSFTRNPEVTQATFTRHGKALYDNSMREEKDSHIPDPSVPDVIDEDEDLEYELTENH